LGAALIEGALVADATDLVSDIANLTQTLLAELRSLDHPVLADALRRVAEEAKDSNDAIAGFQAVI
jgi:FXSXX-COOH protein